MRSTVPSSQSLRRSKFCDQNWSSMISALGSLPLGIGVVPSSSISPPEDQALKGGQMTKCIKQIRIGFPALRKGNLQKTMSCR